MDTNVTTRAAAEADTAVIVPAVDIVEDEHGITLKADLPGVSKEELAIGIDGDNLTIEGTVKLGESSRMQPVYAEIRVAHYKRSFVLSRDLDGAKIDAAMKNGVLTLTVPKAEAAKPRRIAVRAD
jgi:HSP20 family molecular chaperone IbpA